MTYPYFYVKINIFYSELNMVKNFSRKLAGAKKLVILWGGVFMYSDVAYLM